MWAKQKGFTIVELLIVIVIIAVLAAITVVAFNGTQARAKLSKKQHDFSSIVKASSAYAVINTSFTVEENTTQANKDTYITAMGLDSAKPLMVFDTGLALNGTSCFQAGMTKDKYCIYLSSTSNRVTYWHDIDKVWKTRSYSQGQVTETNSGTGTYPDYQSY